MNIREKILCLKCDQEFTDERYLIQHYRIVHKDIPPGFEEKEKFMCDQCPSVFFNKLSLKLHCKNKRAFQCMCKNSCFCQYGVWM